MDQPVKSRCVCRSAVSSDVRPLVLCTFSYCSHSAMFEYAVLSLVVNIISDTKVQLVVSGTSTSWQLESSFVVTPQQG